jgi:hypothetical protein
MSVSNKWRGHPARRLNNDGGWQDARATLVNTLFPA